MKNTLDYNEMTRLIESGKVWEADNYPGGAWTDGDFFYNRSGQMLRDISEYDPYSEGYTPFGDE